LQVDAAGFLFHHGDELLEPSLADPSALVAVVGRQQAGLAHELPVRLRANMQPGLRPMLPVLYFLSMLLCACARASAAPPPPATHPAASVVPAPVAAVPRLASFDDLAVENPNIRQQYEDWRDLRARSGQDPADYQAFREHLLALGAPDPGEQEITDFLSPTTPPWVPD
jgi:hypothetical protein